MAERASWEHMRDDFVPDALADQIAQIKKQIAIAQNVLSNQVRRQQLNPVHMAIEMHRLRSILFTLEKLAAGDAPAAANDSAGASAPH